MSDETTPDAAAAMDEQAMGDEVYQPVDRDEQDARRDPDLENALNQRGLDEQLDEGYSPPERPFAVDDYGTTAGEQREGESLDERLSREQPDVAPPGGDGIGDQRGLAGEPRAGAEVGDARAGRIAEPEEGFPLRDQDIVAREVGIDGGAAGAEESAMHIVDEEPLTARQRNERELDEDATEWGSSGEN